MLTIHLHNLLFHSFHGLYAEEKKIGATFEVNVDVDLEMAEAITHIDQTIDYVSIYNIVSDKMKQPAELLETVAENILETIFKKDKRIKKIIVSIFKINPPIPKFQGKLGITLCKEF
jgi:7,8-dihydroneopterin aldolase/epimerase/oxygenase